MLAISLWQPWASAMALGLKHNETRGWPTQYRGDLAICSSKREMTADDRETYDILVKPDFDYVIPYGCVVCVVNVRDCVPTRLFHDGTLPLSGREAALGNYYAIDPVTCKPRYAWLTDNLRRLKDPVPIKGCQGFWSLPPDLEAKVRAQI